MVHIYDFWFMTEAQERIHILNYVYILMEESHNWNVNKREVIIRKKEDEKEKVDGWCNMSKYLKKKSARRNLIKSAEHQFSGNEERG